MVKTYYNNIEWPRINQVRATMIKETNKAVAITKTGRESNKSKQEIHGAVNSKPCVQGNHKINESTKSKKSSQAFKRNNWLKPNIYETTKLLTTI